MKINSANSKKKEKTWRQPSAQAMEKERTQTLERDAMFQEMARQNPTQRHFEWGGSESQKIYEKVAQGPKTKSGRSELYTCAFCGVSKTEKLMICSRCKSISYCSKECQKSHWKAHKKECVSKDEQPKVLRLTWDQVEAHQGAPVTGKTLEVKAMLDESMMRQVISCKDRAGVVRRVAAYTNSRQIPGLRVGSTLLWKNPRFHYFMDGSSGARIEEEDLVNITVKN